MRWKQSRAARLVGPVALLLFAVTGAGVSIANAGNIAGPGTFGPGMMYGRGGQTPSPGYGGMMGRGLVGSHCTAPAVAGQLVRFRAMDSGRMMGGTMMRLMPAGQAVRAGSVTIQLDNVGTRPHELLVYRQGANEQAGSRVVLDSDRIAENTSMGEVEPVCTQPADLDGIAAGNSARVSLTLTPGRYEVVCNLPGHYRAGMWATLVVQ